MKEADVIELLDLRYSATNPGNGPRYATATHIKSSAGFYARRQMDYFAMDLWPSSGLQRIGHEIKCSRSDWLRELKDPSKAAAFRPYMHAWFLVVTDAAFVRPGELPEGWGLIVANPRRCRQKVPARRIEPLPLPNTMLGCLLRATQLHHFRRGFAQRGSLWERDGA